ncbi:hypothetical protein [Nisaea sp.]|uniref:hypothetical protein n=1 Tax=Nisaea sp. TaxID=2024842 RepID=UPI002B273D3E|nr:hypothetical protein [Nisaea sp.]
MAVLILVPVPAFSAGKESVPTIVDGILVWQPRFGEFATQDPSPPGLSDHPHLTRLTPPDCGRLRDLLAGDEEDYRIGIVAWDHFLLLPCLLHVLQKTAHPAPVGGIDMADPVPDIVERLDIRSFRSSLGPALPDGQGPVTLRYFFGASGADPDAVLTRRRDSFDYLSRYDGKESWFRKLSLLAAADWAGDGKGELLVSWEDNNLGGGTYFILDLMFLKAEGPDAPITATHVQDWLFVRREAIIRLLR